MNKIKFETSLKLSRWADIKIRLRLARAACKKHMKNIRYFAYALPAFSVLAFWLMAWTQVWIPWSALSQKENTQTIALQENREAPSKLSERLRSIWREDTFLERRKEIRERLLTQNIKRYQQLAIVHSSTTPSVR